MVKKILVKGKIEQELFQFISILINLLIQKVRFFIL